MSTEVSAASSGAALDKQTTAATSGAAQEKPGQYVTLEQFQKVLDRMDGISGSLRKLEPIVTAIEPKQQSKEPDTLKSLREQIDAREAKMTARERIAALNEALETNGVPSERRGKAAKYILAEHAAKISQLDDGTFKYSENGQEHALQDWVALYLKTDDGKFINPEIAPLLPTSKGLSAGKSTTQSGQSAGLKMTFKELMEPKNADVRMKMMSEHPDEWRMKQDEFYKRN